MTRRYYVPNLRIAAAPASVSLPDAEALHAIRVMRVKAGDRITLFDGHGYESEAIVTSVTKRKCDCDAQAAVAVDREPSHRLHLGIALPKADRARELMERLTELGVSVVTPLVAERTQWAASSGLLAKLGRAVVEASKQCGRNELMRITASASAESFFREASSGDPQRWIAHPGGTLWRQLPEHSSNETVVAIGPEGGWSDAELAEASDCGFAKVGLGKRVYRIETAAAFFGSLFAD